MLYNAVSKALTKSIINVNQRNDLAIGYVVAGSSLRVSSGAQASEK